MLTLLILVAAGAALNMLRGGSFVRLPFRSLFVAAPLMGLVSLITLEPLQAVYVAVGFLIWGSIGWGRWYNLGTKPRGVSGPPNWFERTLESTGWSDDTLFTIRNALMISPLWVMVSGVFAWLPILQWAAYAYARHCTPDKGSTRIAEGLTGAAWGALIFLASTTG